MQEHTFKEFNLINVNKVLHFVDTVSFGFASRMHASDNDNDNNYDRRSKALNAKCNTLFNSGILSVATGKSCGFFFLEQTKNTQKFTTNKLQ